MSVCLTTTGHLVAQQGHFLDDVLVRGNIPVCVVEAGLGIFGKESEQMEHIMAQAILTGSKLVHIDAEKKFVFVGEDPSDFKTATVEYIENSMGDKTPSSDFFSRWLDTESMFFEFQVEGVNITDMKSTGVLFCILGLWKEGKWDMLEVSPTKKFYIKVV